MRIFRVCYKIFLSVLFWALIQFSFQAFIFSTQATCPEFISLAPLPVGNTSICNFTDTQNITIIACMYLCTAVVFILFAIYIKRRMYFFFLPLFLNAIYAFVAGVLTTLSPEPKYGLTIIFLLIGSIFFSWYGYDLIEGNNRLDAYFDKIVEGVRMTGKRGKALILLIIIFLILFIPLFTSVINNFNQAVPQPCSCIYNKIQPTFTPMPPVHVVQILSTSLDANTLHAQIKNTTAHILSNIDIQIIFVTETGSTLSTYIVGQVSASDSIPADQTTLVDFDVTAIAKMMQEQKYIMQIYNYNIKPLPSMTILPPITATPL